MNEFIQQEIGNIVGSFQQIPQADGLMSIVEAVNGAISSIVWGMPMILLILAVGFWLSIGNGFVQIRHFFYAIKHSIGSMLKKSPHAASKSLTPFQAVATALSASLGTGNISGVAVAISVGGPGAIFWMWVSALLGMATKYSEILLAVRFRQKNSKGEWIGGPMYAIVNGLGKRWHWLAAAFCLMGVLSSFGIGNISQVNSLVLAVDDLLLMFSAAPEQLNLPSINLLQGIVLAILLAIMLLGGLKRIGKVAATLVPIMAVFYLVGSAGVLLVNAGQIGAAFETIFSHALGLQPMAGGAAGFSVSMALKHGFARGIFSNEAGLGSAPIAHASAEAKSPVHQGLYGIFEVFFDTFIICTATALVILVSGVPIAYGETVGTTLVTSAFASLFGGKSATLFLALALSAFCISSMLGWSLYGLRCIEFLFGEGSAKPYLLFYVLVIIVGAVMDLRLAWSISDTMNALMTIPNLIALALLGRQVFAATKAHFAGG